MVNLKLFREELVHQLVEDRLAIQELTQGVLDESDVRKANGVSVYTPR